MQLAGRQAQKSRNESKKLQQFSKQWTAGDTLRTYYPIFKNENGSWDIAVGAVWGYAVNNIKELQLKTAFIPSLVPFDDATGKPVGKGDITYQFSKIARCFVNGARKQEELAIASKKFPSEELRKEALAQIEAKYDTKNNRDAKKPIISSPRFMILVECVTVKWANGAPIMDTATVCTMPLSEPKINAIYSILDNPAFTPQDGEEFLEVEWKFPANADKGQSGQQATCSGITADYKLSNTHPAAWSSIKSRLSGVMREPESITRRAVTAISEERVRAAITKYAALNSETLDYLDDENIKVLTNNVDVVNELGLISTLSDENTITQLKEALSDYQRTYTQEAAATVNEVPEPDLTQAVTEAYVATPSSVEPISSIPTPVESIATVPSTVNVTDDTANAMSPVDIAAATTPHATTQAPSLDALMNNPARFESDNMDDVDLAI